ncbi:RES domain-containing protein [Mycolicibacterium mageritense]|uniref:RES domain-containing protein n=1 Tax=Mycolicibacterium mageritense TaxID=53462 RepID=UPI001E407C9E|nr:RES domain-containing protein [Mycolicibacterium mageritense]MCC9185327.1 RES domain-containing protein [Mycolicibacterium mageritense]
MSSLDAATVCTSTGLDIVACRGQSIFRVAHTEYGPINPPPRVPRRDPVEGWSRWDTAGRTIYGCTTATGAMVEVLAYIQPDPPPIPLVELFDDVDERDAETLAAQIARELPAHGAMKYQSISKGWRDARSIYELSLPTSGWFVDITGAHTIATLTEQLGPTLLANNGIEQVTVSELTSSSEKFKSLTTGIATWIREQVTLFDGDRPHGIVYPSKWGTTLGHNYAMWLRRVDDQTGVDRIAQLDAVSIGRHTEPFIEAARLRGMTIY